MLVFTLNLVSPYTAPTYNSINFTLCSEYTPPTYNSINFTLGDDDSCITDTCTYSSGDWGIEFSDNCVIGENVIMNGGLVFNGTGTFIMNANITNYSSLEIKELSSGYEIILNDGTHLRSS